MTNELPTNERYDGRGTFQQGDRLYYGQRISPNVLPLSVSEMASEHGFDISSSSVWIKRRIWCSQSIEYSTHTLSVCCVDERYIAEDGRTIQDAKYPESIVNLSFVSINCDETVWYVGQDSRKEACYWVEFYSEPTVEDLNTAQLSEALATAR